MWKVYVSLYTCNDVYVCIHMYIHICIMRIYIGNTNRYMYFHMYMYVCIMYIHIHALRSSRERHDGMYFCIHTYVYVSMYIYVYIYMYYVYIYIFMYIHRYTMCIHIPVPWPPRGRHDGVRIFLYTHVHASMHGLSHLQWHFPKLGAKARSQSSQVSFHWKVRRSLFTEKWPKRRTSFSSEL